MPAEPAAGPVLRRVREQDWAALRDLRLEPGGLELEMTRLLA